MLLNQCPIVGGIFMAQANVLFRDFFFCLSPTDTQIHVIPQQKLNLTGVAQCIILFDAKNPVHRWCILEKAMHSAASTRKWNIKHIAWESQLLNQLRANSLFFVNLSVLHGSTNQWTTPDQQ